MRYKREETFRYEFNPPLSCSFTIVKVDNYLSVPEALTEKS
jgi:hypothetical protein